MRKVLYIIGLTAFAASCTAQKSSKKNKRSYERAPITTTKTVVVEKSEPTIDCNGESFYKKNIADITKNDNTESYGSIVTAKPKGFKVVKKHFPSLGQNFRQKYLIIHYTALNTEKSARVLTQQSVSAHYLVNDSTDLEIYQLVDENKRAYHAGISYWRDHRHLNDNSIGIEIVNQGYTTDEDGKKIFYPFNRNQIKKVAALVKDIVDRYNIPPTNVLGHADVAPTRKQDPGPYFPWKMLHDQYGVGMWYDESTKMAKLADLSGPTFDSVKDTTPFIYKFQSYLRTFGYSITPTGVWDDENRKVVEAFQYHFRPKNYDGVVDRETWAILQALLVKYPG